MTLHFDKANPDLLSDSCIIHIIFFNYYVYENILHLMKYEGIHIK